MPLSLSKEQKPLQNANGQPLTKFSFGVGWDVSGQGKKGLLRAVNRLKGVDLDASVVAFDAAGEAKNICYPDNTNVYHGALIHTGDNKTGKGEGADETIKVDLDQLPDQVTKLVCVLSSYKGVTFDKVNNTECMIIDESSGSPVTVAWCEPGIEPGRNAVVMAKVERTSNGWVMSEVQGGFGMAGNREDVLRLAKQHA